MVTTLRYLATMNKKLSILAIRMLAFNIDTYIQTEDKGK